MSIEHGGGGSLSVFSEGCHRLWLLMVDGWCGSWAFVLILGGDGRSLMVVAGVGTVFACWPWEWLLLRWGRLTSYGNGVVVG